MVPSVAVILQPDVDFKTFLALSHTMLGYSPAAAADQSRTVQSDTERFLSCLAALRDSKAPAGLTPNLLAFASVGIYVAAEERDLIDIAEACAGMPFVAAETVSRGVMAAVIVGNLAQWRDAVKTGTSQAAEYNVRSCFNSIMTLFSQAGLAAVWKDYESKPLNDQTFCLEFKRR